ncbi:MAG: hypothetical protein ACRCTQ_04170 [Brevinemataceae bacterium]
MIINNYIKGSIVGIFTAVIFLASCSLINGGEQQWLNSIQNTSWNNGVSGDSLVFSSDGQTAQLNGQTITFSEMVVGVAVYTTSGNSSFYVFSLQSGGLYQFGPYNSVGEIVIDPEQGTFWTKV